ncbi:MAG: hypothetical protein ACYST2_03905 [Planctomycetota bacterium]|jgi:hypothetical protein
MNRWIFYVLIFSLSVCLCFSSGCEQAHEQEVAAKELVQTPQKITKDVVPDYINGALSATGGRELWQQTKEIEYDCVATFYRPDGSLYLTEQHHLIKPWSRQIRISATEPYGTLVCEFTPELFKVLEGSVSKKGLPQGLCERELAEALLEALTGSVSFLDKNTMFTRMDKPVKIEGSWYYAIEHVEPVQFNQEDIKDSEDLRPVIYWSKVIFYQRTDSLLVDILRFDSFERQEYIGVRCYDYKGIVMRDTDSFEPNGVFMPRKIELFRADSKGIFHEKIVGIDIKNCSYVPF